MGQAKDPCALLTWKVDDFLHGEHMADIEKARREAYKFTGLDDHTITLRIQEETAREKETAHRAGIARTNTPGRNAGGRTMQP